MDERRSIGQVLRQRREERGLAPEQAAEQSKVPLRLLQALEADDYHVLPDAFYLIRFLHDYARWLKLDPAALEEQFRHSIRRPSKGTFVPGPTPSPSPAIPWRQLLWTAAAILAVTPLVFIALSLASKRAAERPAPPPIQERPMPQPPPSDRAEQAREREEGADLLDRLLKGTPEGSPRVEPPGLPEPAAPRLPRPSFREPSESAAPSPPRDREAPAAPEPPRAQSQPSLLRPQPPGQEKPRRFLLTARALETTWMAVRADGGQVREVLLQKGQTARFSAETGFRITLGNAGGVDLSLNGERVPSMGASGQVVRDRALP
jgi:cytoskeleton protein RodZ